MRTLGLCALAVWCAAVPCYGQGLDPAALLRLATDTWPTYNGDYSGRRFSPLDGNQRHPTSDGLALAWLYRITRSARSAAWATPLSSRRL